MQTKSVKFTPALGQRKISQLPTQYPGVPSHSKATTLGDGIKKCLTLLNINIFMKLFFTLLICSLSIFSFSQPPINIETNVSEIGTSEKIELSKFHLNHVLYIKAFILSDIYSSVTAEEMAYINSTLLKNIKDGKRTQFIIKTQQKIPYRLAVYVTQGEKGNLLVMLTNFNPAKGIFEKKIKDDFYATSADLNNGIAIGNMFELPLKNEKIYKSENDYTSLINMSIFNTKVDTSLINNWFSLSKKTQPDLVNNYNWLRSYYFLSIDNFTESRTALNNLKESVAGSPEGERNNWAMMIKVLEAEIEILNLVEN